MTFRQGEAEKDNAATNIPLSVATKLGSEKAFRLLDRVTNYSAEEKSEMT